MKRTLLLTTFAATLLLASLGCSTPFVQGDAAQPSTSKTTDLVVWKKSKDPSAQFDLNKEKSTVPLPHGTNEKITTLFALLKQQKKDSLLEPTVPENVNLINAQISDQTLYLNFNDAVKQMTPSQEGIFVKSVNYTMLQNFSGDATTQFSKIAYQVNGNTIKVLSKLQCNQNEICWEPFLSAATK